MTNLIFFVIKIEESKFTSAGDKDFRFYIIKWNEVIFVLFPIFLNLIYKIENEKKSLGKSSKGTTCF